MTSSVSTRASNNNPPTKHDNNMEKETQTKIILERLQDGDKITALEAFKLCGSLRLSSIIYSLRDKGYNIHTEMVTRNNKRIAEYSLIEERRKKK